MEKQHRSARVLKFVVPISLLLHSIACTTAGGGNQSRGEGILVTELHSNFNNITLSFMHEKGEDISSASINVQPDDNFRVMSLPAGRYTWKSIIVDGWRTNIKGDYSFIIKGGALNYIGDVLLKVDGADVRIKFINKSSAIKLRLSKEYAALYRQFPYIVNITKTEEY